MMYKEGDKVVLFSVEEFKNHYNVQFTDGQIETVLGRYEKAGCPEATILGVSSFYIPSFDVMFPIKQGGYIARIHEACVKGFSKSLIGLKPLKNWEEGNNKERISDIIDAMTRYSENEKVIPLEWISELYGIISNVEGYRGK